MSKGQVMKPSLRKSDLQQFREEVEEDRLCPELHSSEMLCSPRCNAFCQPLQIVSFCENSNTLQCVSMQGMGLDHMRRETIFPLVREHSGRSKHISN